MNRRTRALAVLLAALLLASPVLGVLPQQLKSARMTDSTPARNIDNEVGNLEKALSDILGLPLDTDITAAPFSITAAGIVTIAQNSLAAAGATLTINDNLVVSGVGPHAIGGVTDPTIQLFLQGNFSGSQGLVVSNTLNPAVGANAFIANFGGTIVEAGSGTHGDFTALNITPPTITAGGATLTNATTLKITGAPTGATNNYALWSVAGINRFDGASHFAAGSAAAPGITFVGQSDLGLSRSGSDLLISTVGTERARLTGGGSWTLSAAGPHAIGGATDPAIQVSVRGSFSPADISSGYGFAVYPTLTIPANRSAQVIYSGGTLTKAASGTHADFVGLNLDAPVIGAGAAALTNASTLKITGAPVGATNNYALWVAAGVTRLQGDLNHDLGNIVFGNQATPAITTGSTALRFINSTSSIERMRLTDGGVLLLGTTTLGNAAAGDLVVKRHGAFGADSGIDEGNDDSIVRIEEVTSTQTSKHSLGLTVSHAWAPGSNPSSRFSVGLDILEIGAPTGGTTIPESIGHSITMQKAGGSASGTITKASGLIIRTPVIAGATVTWTNSYGLDIEDQEVASIATTKRAVRIANNNYFWARNNAGSADVALLGLNAGDLVLLSPSGNDILWGRALVALGAGANATLGNTGGSGPATIAQNSWMRVVDSTGAAFWVPAWK